MSEPDLDTLARLERLYGRAFVHRLVAAGEEAGREGQRGGEPPEEIVARVRLRQGRAVRTLVEVWRPVE